MEASLISAGVLKSRSYSFFPATLNSEAATSIPYQGNKVSHPAFSVRYHSLHPAADFGFLRIILHMRGARVEGIGSTNGRYLGTSLTGALIMGG